MADALGTGGAVVSAVDHRLDQAGLIAAQTSSLAVRTGVMVAPGSTALITGTSATGTMTVSIAAHHWVTTRGTADGVYLGTKEAAGTVNIAAAPGSNSRIDVVYVKQNDAGSSITPDGSTAEAYAVVTGTAAVSPTKPALPVGAVELGTVTVAAGATSTNGAGVTIANTVAQVSSRGAKVWVRNQTERDALTKYAGLEVYRIDTGDKEMVNTAGTGWVTTYTPAATGAWVNQYAGLENFLQAGTGTATVLSGCSTSAVVPVGRTLEVDLHIPRISVPASGGLFVRLSIGGTYRRTAAVQTPAGVSMAVPAYLTASVPGTGASIPFFADIYAAGSGGTVLGSGDGVANGGPFFRYRII